MSIIAKRGYFVEIGFGPEVCGLFPAGELLLPGDLARLASNGKVYNYATEFVERGGYVCGGVMSKSRYYRGSGEWLHMQAKKHGTSKWGEDTLLEYQEWLKETENDR